MVTNYNSDNFRTFVSYMRLLNIKLLIKLKNKKKGNKSLLIAIDRFIDDVTLHLFSNPFDLMSIRQDADNVHSDGFYFFDIDTHRVLVLIEFTTSDATIVWAGSHEQYEQTFKNNKKTIYKWLKNREWI